MARLLETIGKKYEAATLLASEHALEVGERPPLTISLILKHLEEMKSRVSNRVRFVQLCFLDAFAGS